MTAPELTDTVRDLPAPFAPDLIDLLPDAVWAFDPRNRIVGWNHAAAALYRLPADAAVGQPVALFVPHAGLDAFQRAVEAVRRDGRWAGELLTRTAVGHRRVVDARWVLAEDGRLVVAIHTDVTDRRAAASAADRAARWAAVRGVAAAVAAEPGPRGDWVAQVRRFAHGPDPVAADPTLHAGGDGVLVAAASPTLRELTRAMLAAAGYSPLAAADRFEAARVMAAFPDRVRAAALGFGPENPAVAALLRQSRADLPVVSVGGPADPDADDPCHVPAPAEPVALLRAVAEAVAADRLAEAARPAT